MNRPSNQLDQDMDNIGTIAALMTRLVEGQPVSDREMKAVETAYRQLQTGGPRRHAVPDVHNEDDDDDGFEHQEEEEIPKIRYTSRR
jgi:hypothetical protein